MSHFSPQDRALIEALKFDPAARPSFDLLKACLIWPDERPTGLSPDDYDALCDLWIARSFLHRGVPISEDYFRKAWEEAQRDELRWPGFSRVTLSDRDQAYLESGRSELAGADTH